MSFLDQPPKAAPVRIMVTMPSEAAQSYELVKSLIEAGMDVMRVNCAHDSEHEWECMIANMRRASQESGKPCKVLMDLGGPKLRTGPSTRLIRALAGWQGRAGRYCRARAHRLGRQAPGRGIAAVVRRPTPRT